MNVYRFSEYSSRFLSSRLNSFRRSSYFVANLISETPDSLNHLVIHEPDTNTFPIINSAQILQTLEAPLSAACSHMM